MSETPENPGHELERQHPPLAQPEPGAAAATEPGAQPSAGLAEHGVRARAGEPGLAASATHSPADATRAFDTAQGRLSYAELAERLAAPLLEIDVRQRRGEYAESPLNEALLLGLHAELSGALFPEEAGRYRQKSVQVGVHEPPPPSLVAPRMRDYIGNLSERMHHLNDEADDLLLEFLAYAEGELLSIHPFPDLNGRMSRLWLTEILRRLHLPPVDVVPPSDEFRARYLDALGAADRRDWTPLMALWKERLSQPAAVNDIVLTGCNPTPLASYLKGLAVLRLVAESGVDEGGDPQASGFWRDDVFVLRTRLTREQLSEFFLERYRPTPLISPWNGRAGFLEGGDDDDDESEVTQLAVEAEDDGESTRIGAEMVRVFTPTTLHSRFGPIKKAIEGFQRVRVLDLLNVSRSKAKALEAEIKKNKKAQLSVLDGDEDRLKSLKADNIRLKAQVLLQLRNEADEGWLSWFDACQSLAQISSTKEQDRNKPQHAPLLGKGGVDGSMDFGVNFQKRITELFDLTTGNPLPICAFWLDHALFDLTTAGLIAIKPGQFHPGVGKFPNSGNGFLGEELGNPWNSMFSLEGAMLFATATSRRLESSDPGMLSAPFTVTSRVSGVGSANLRDESEKLTNGEIWMPLWSAPASFDEVRCLLTEGRASINGRTARDGLDFARAVAQLGVDRGIKSFQRFGFLKRFGKTYLAAPLTRLPVRRNDASDLISDLERRDWLRAVQQYGRGKLAPDSFRSAVHQLDTALFALTQQASRETLQAVLRHVGHIDTALGISAKAREAVRAPAPRLSVAWAMKASDDSAEFRIAAALAGLTLRSANGYAALHTRRHLVAVGEAANNEGDRQWEPTSRVATWGAGPLVNNLAALLHRRRLEAVRLGVEGELLAAQYGATRDDLAAFIDGQTDDARIADLLAGLACVDLSQLAPPQGQSKAVLPPAFALLKIFFTPESVLRPLRFLPEDRSLHLPAEIPARLAANQAQTAVSLAWQRLRALGIKLPGRDPPQVVVADGPRWLAALCIPLAFKESAGLLRALQLDPASETTV